MKTFLFSILAATATAQSLMGEWCDECTALVNAFDTMDSQSIADQLCPFIEEDSLCEELAPYVIEWVQEHCTADLVCSYLCDDYYTMYDEYGYPFLFDFNIEEDLQHPYDIPPKEDPPVDLHEARDIPEPQLPPLLDNSTIVIH